MRDLAILFIHLIATITKLIGPGGARAVIAESLLLKHLELPRFRGRFIACAIMKCFSNHSASNRIPKARAVRSAW